MLSLTRFCLQVQLEDEQMQAKEPRSDPFNKWPISGKLCSYLENILLFWTHTSPHTLNQFPMDRCLIAKDWNSNCPSAQYW